METPNSENSQSQGLGTFFRICFTLGVGATNGLLQSELFNKPEEKSFLLGLDVLSQSISIAAMQCIRDSEFYKKYETLNKRIFINSRDIAVYQAAKLVTFFTIKQWEIMHTMQNNLYGLVFGLTLSIPLSKLVQYFNESSNEFPDNWY